MEMRVCMCCVEVTPINPDSTHRSSLSRSYLLAAKTVQLSGGALPAAAHLFFFLTTLIDIFCVKKYFAAA